jgi:hypothetical protein
MDRIYHCITFQETLKHVLDWLLRLARFSLAMLRETRFSRYLMACSHEEAMILTARSTEMCLCFTLHLNYGDCNILKCLLCLQHLIIHILYWLQTLYHRSCTCLPRSILHSCIFSFFFMMPRSKVPDMYVAPVFSIERN